VDNGDGEGPPPGMEERFRYPGPKLQHRRPVIVGCRPIPQLGGALH